ncbi:MAG: NlpC/P60 family protein [Chthoniobacter sp.]|uniref:C40 family peptidase n=1 Tax=Chthoniobacter sp. TaxID=2510640 RepID=UPI0032A5EDE0
MNRYFVWIAALAGVALFFGNPVESHAAKKKKKPVAASADDDAATPAPKHSSTPPLDLPLPSKTKTKTKTEEPGDATPAPKKAAAGEATPTPKPAEKTEKSTEKTGDKTATEAKAKPEHAPNATVEPEEIAEFATQPPRLQQLIRDAIDLTRLNLTYTFGSADPDGGGMDCSGTIYYLLKAHNFADVPRDSSGQYLWARRGGAFFPVVSKSAEGVEFKELLPGDLMFWTGTYDTGRDVPISHVMMYLGREKGSGKRIMFGASDGRSYNGVQRWGVSVFDFKMPGTNPEKAKVEFVGYARVPGLRGPAPAPMLAAEDTADAAKKDAPATTPAPSKSKKGSTTAGKKKKKTRDD